MSHRTENDENEYNSRLKELDERIFKLINTFLKKLENQNFLDQIYNTSPEEEIKIRNDDERGDAANTQKHSH